ncbi:pyruvate synthase subunit beta [Clostridium sp. MSJ-8]|uniref:thiamine pyrophosphate-dependent enzyme n=1 Tax=Clostridium sp. MSJ-8 TaxID=2841510 RepID=UPI001C0EE81B|nr:thiamine pyrophosphate-dependent enzyme [Clostridium sp. MSJ-8]MBU5486934.1 pyruvate synthase subunit beta [Clostridium sp. MSJ-8]
MSIRITANNISDNEFFYGHKACAGCGGSLAVRMALKVLGERTFTAIPAGCMSAVGFNFPQLCFSNNAIISTFAGTGSMLTGMAAAAKVLKLKDYNIVGIAGDGGTADIGIQALSGAIDRGDKIIYICYDNEAYMNTGIQKSGLTPFGAKTTTTPAGKNVHGNIKNKKNMFEIIAAHNIPYAATASIAYMEDFLYKVKRASEVDGPSYIHVIAPCPTGWGIPVDETVNIAKEVVDCGLWYLAEYYDGEFYINKVPKQFSSIKDYLKKQSRFSKLDENDLTYIEEQRNEKWKQIKSKWITQKLS